MLVGKYTCIGCNPTSTIPITYFLHTVDMSFVLKCPLTPTLATLSLVVICTVHMSHYVRSEYDLSDLESFKLSWRGPLTNPLEEGLDDDSVIDISTKNKEKYRCIVPSYEEQASFETSARNSSSREKPSNPFEYLAPLLRSSFCSYKFGLYWVYELCHGQYLKQYHEETSRHKSRSVTQEYVLGRDTLRKVELHAEAYEKEQAELEKAGKSRPTVFVNGLPKPYVTVTMAGGTRCDLTKKERVTKVLYVCHESTKHELYSIEETSTCEYEAIVLSPLLCLHNDFRVDTTVQHEIKCYSLNGAPVKPANSIDEEEDDDEARNSASNRGIAYFQGRTLIIDAD